MRNLVFFILSLILIGLPTEVLSQGVTTCTVSGSVVDEAKEPVIGASIEVIHVPSGTKSLTTTSVDGTFNIQGLRVGGPYTVKLTYIGFRTQKFENLQLSLGSESVLNVVMKEDVEELGEVVISGNKNAGMKTTTKSGVGVIINSSALSSMPTVSRSINDFTRMVPQAGDNGMLGKGGKSNNVTVDGASFNNFFGLGSEKGGMPGANANAEPISLDALEQISVEGSPYDVKLGGFTGAGINVVTRSGDNTVRASFYDYYRNQELSGHKIKDVELTKSHFNENTVGFRIGGPIIKNKLFFFANAEYVKYTSPVGYILMGRSGLSGSNISSVKAETLDQLKSFLQSQYGYNPGDYENVDRTRESLKFLIKLDWNIDDKNKFSIRYNQLNAKSLNGNLGTVSTGRFDGLLYNRENQVYSITGELNSTISNKLSNKLFAAYNSMPDFRSPYKRSVFPYVSITDGSTTIQFGTDGAANENRVDQKVFQLQDEATYLYKKNKFTAGVNWQYLNLTNNFTYNPQGSFTFNSLADFYNSAPKGTNTPIGTSTGEGRPEQYSLAYTVQPGRTVTMSNPKISQLGIYLQDEINFSKVFSLTGGFRFDIISILGNPSDNTAVKDMTFQSATGSSLHYNTSETPGTKLLISPRLGFTWRPDAAQKLTIKGGAGLFTGVIPFVYIEKAYSINGMNEGAINAKGDAAANYPFNPSNAYYKPESGSLLSSYELNLVSKDYKMPQTLRASLGVDYRLPGDWTFGVEGIYSKDFNSPYYMNVNLDQKSTTVATDGRTYYTNNRLNQNITNAYALDCTNKGYSMFLTTTLKKYFDFGLNLSMSYSYGQSKSPYDFTSTTPGGAFKGIPVVGNPNKPTLAYSAYDLRHRVVIDLSYKASYAKERLYTTVGLFFSASQQGRSSYIYGGNGDVNGDGVSSNDLIFIPADRSQINLVPYTSGGTTITVEEQWKALDEYISSSKYLNSRRGQYAERNGLLNPWYAQADLHITQGICQFKNQHKFEITFDILNFTNLLNKNWGVIQTPANSTLITAKTKDTFTVSPDNLKKGEFIPYSDSSSAWMMQIGFRYTFN